MKYIQVVTNDDNCTFDIFLAADEDFGLLFPQETDIAFIDEVYARNDNDMIFNALERISKNRVKKTESKGIHGILFFGNEKKKDYYPTRKDEEAINPDGTRLR